tara:strand:- start:29698 stop:30702 length:1005 start_codon:yes stop_codon:yes gene_type:complete
MTNKNLTFQTINDPDKKTLEILKSFFKTENQVFVKTMTSIYSDYGIKHFNLSSLVKKFSEAKIKYSCRRCSREIIKPFKSRTHFLKIEIFEPLCSLCIEKQKEKLEIKKNLNEERQLNRKLALLKNAVVSERYKNLSNSARIKLKQIFTVKTDISLDFEDLKTKDPKHDKSISELIENELILVQGEFDSLNLKYTKIRDIIVDPNLEDKFQKYLSDLKDVYDSSDSIAEKSKTEYYTEDEKVINLNATELSFLLRFSKNDYSKNLICSGEITIPEDIEWDKGDKMVYGLFKSEKNGYHLSIKSKSRILNYRNKTIDNQPNIIKNLIDDWKDSFG